MRRRSSGAAARPRRWTTRARWPRRLEIPYYLLNCGARVRARGDRAVRARVRGRPDAGAVRGVQPRGEVRLARAARAGVGRDRGRDRPLRAHHAGPRLAAAFSSGVAETRARTSPIFSGRSRRRSSRRRAFPSASSPRTRCARRRAALGLVTAEKPESQEICFIPDDDYRGFLRRRVPEAFVPGPILDGQGTVLGRHEGLANYTIGQRRGLGLTSARPLYVTALDPARNAVVVGGADEGGVESPPGGAGEPHQPPGPDRPARGGGQDPAYPRAGGGDHRAPRGWRGEGPVRAAPASPRAGPVGGVLPGRSGGGWGRDRAPGRPLTVFPRA